MVQKMSDLLVHEILQYGGIAAAILGIVRLIQMVRNIGKEETEAITELRTETAVLAERLERHVDFGQSTLAAINAKLNEIVHGQLDIVQRLSALEGAKKGK